MGSSVTVPAGDPAQVDRGALLERYVAVRAATEALCTGLATEDFVVQSMADVSPTKWHLAHTSWFFEEFVLRRHAPGYAPLDPAYLYLFNSYYVQAGERHCRDQRGYISRPTVAQVFDYRAHVDGWIAALLETVDDGTLAGLAPLLELGLNHEQQHQELVVTDIKHVFSVNPLRPVFRERPERSAPMAPGTLEWIEYDETVAWIGAGGNGFAYDNERPRHRQIVYPFRIASRPATNGEFLAFMDDGGYQRAELWLSDGWAAVQASGWTEPFYWERRDGEWWTYTLAGMRPVNAAEPVCHLSYYEADAFARWARARLPTEAEWEVAAAGVPVAGNLAGSGRLHPATAGFDPSSPDTGLVQIYGDVWEWTRSPYAAYPGYRPPPGALGEYNAKFMSNQFVLRGGSCATPDDHIRASYRNFFPPDATWQFSGVRLARDSD